MCWKYDREELELHKNQILQTLMYFKIEIEKIKATIGPTVTLYEIVPARGIRISKIKSLEDDIALNLSALGIRIIAPIPGKRRYRYRSAEQETANGGYQGGTHGRAVQTGKNGAAHRPGQNYSE
jgi:DNA segregation ATPase FtsK/SpoIIIE-like protein